MAGLYTEASYCCRPCLRRLAIPSQSRSFASTPSRRKHGGLPHFTVTSSPELDNLLSTFRSNIFLPSHLLRLQRNLLYKPKNVALLTSDEPATVRVGNEVLQMLPLNHLRDEPPTRQSFNKILDLMKDGKDWQNLPGFLEGLKTAKRHLQVWQIEKMVRRANMAGRQGAVLECLRRPGTGVRLTDVRVVREVMWGAVMKAQQGNWEKEAVEQAVKFARAVWDLLEDPKHVMKSRDTGSEHIARARPEIVGVMLQLEAAKTLLLGEGKDEGGKVESIVEMLLWSWTNADLASGGGEMEWFDADYKVLMWAPLWHGMKLARKVLGENSKHGKLLAEKMDQDLVPAMKAARDVVVARAAPTQERLRRGVKMYEELAGVSL